MKVYVEKLLDDKGFRFRSDDLTGAEARQIDEALVNKDIEIVRQMEQVKASKVDEKILIDFYGD